MSITTFTQCTRCFGHRPNTAQLAAMFLRVICNRDCEKYEDYAALHCSQSAWRRQARAHSPLVTLEPPLEPKWLRTLLPTIRYVTA
mmetsp:Transcript_1698/g.1059  ORF Transcript_1698/g.1059 Transcript_1698/m.1059 type:complete len:86 (-) Transcript_1698:1-258(-)